LCCSLSVICSLRPSCFTGLKVGSERLSCVLRYKSLPWAVLRGGGLIIWSPSLISKSTTVQTEGVGVQQAVP
jgi:hypothetical protein